MNRFELAREQLKEYLWSENEKPAHQVAVSKLPLNLRQIGYTILGLQLDGTEFPAMEWHEREALIAKSLQPIDQLSAAKLRQLITTFCPSLADEITRAWAWLKQAPYQKGYGRKPFRCPGRDEITLDHRISWLTSILQHVDLYRPEHLSLEFLAEWGQFAERHASDRCLGFLFASAIDHGGKVGDAVFDILCRVATNEHETAVFSRGVALALLSCGRADAWDLMERTLLAAQRQEGLRQVILETIDEAHPQAFHRMLRLIRDEKLARFAAVTRAVDVWFGLGYESDEVKAVNGAINQVLACFESPAIITEKLATGTAEDVFFALWSLAYRDVDAALDAAAKLTRHKSAETRFALASFLKLVDIVESAHIARTMINDQDLHVATVAFDASRVHTPHAQAFSSQEQQQWSESLRAYFERLPVKPASVGPLVWHWTERKIDRRDAAEELADSLAANDPLAVIPYLMSMGPYCRHKFLRALAKYDQWDESSRREFLQLASSTSSDVRNAAIQALLTTELDENEIAIVESLLTRKPSDLRIGGVQLLLKQNDQNALLSADRLLNSSKSPQRNAGLDLLKQMIEAQRSSSDCIRLVHALADSGAKLTLAETAQLEALLDSSAEAITLENGLGLFDPADLSPPVKVKTKKFQFVTPAAIKLLKSLDDLVHKHRDEPVTVVNWRNEEVTDLLSAVYLPAPDWRKPIAEARLACPLLHIWEDWFHNRPKSLRDNDGQEFLRANNYMETVIDHWWHNVSEWCKTNSDRKPFLLTISGKNPPLKLRYKSQIGGILTWLTYLHPIQGTEQACLDAAETFLASIPESAHQELASIAKDEDYDSHYYRPGKAKDWRRMYGLDEFMKGIGGIWCQSKKDRPMFEQKWRLLRYRDQPFPNAPRYRPDLRDYLLAYQQGLATDADIMDAFIGPRETASSYRRFGDLGNVLLAGGRDDIERDLLATVPTVSELARQARDRILEIELARGDTPTAATPAAVEITYKGAETLARLLQAIGKDGFKVPMGYRTDAAHGRQATLTTMVKQCYPANGDSQQDFNQAAKVALSAGLKKSALLELMFLSPQWAGHVDGYFKWKGLREGLFWYLAHMKYLNVNTESAAHAGGYEGGEKVDQDGQPQHESAWSRLIAERTSLTDSERMAGAIDVEWFHRVYKTLSPKRWNELAMAARFASTPQQAKRATYIGEVLLGKANRKQLFADVTQKKLKESVRLIGLYPLAKGAKRAADLQTRYQLLVDYRQYAKGLSGLTKPDAMAALDVGFRNLASTAGYIDTARMEWSLEAEAVKDLATGPVTIETDGVQVTLDLDTLARPQVSVSKGGKALKSIPSALKKSKQIIDLNERVADLRKQASRMKESLESAMCRGDQFSGAEIRQLMGHALLRPLLSRLVLVSSKTAGFPNADGTGLLDANGKLQKITVSDTLRIAHPCDLYQRKDWHMWQHACFEQGIVQPFKQVFRELYVVTRQEAKDGYASSRYAGQQVNPTQANALWGSRLWHTQDEVFKAFPHAGITASVNFGYGAGSPMDVDGLTLDSIVFHQRDGYQRIKLSDVPLQLFSEVMRDIDLVVSVAHRGNVDPEASASTVEMRESLISETCLLLGLKNVRIKQPRAIIKGSYGEYAVHLGSGNVHLMPGNSLCVVAVQSQHRGRLFLPFADDDPRTAEIISKVILLANDKEIQDPTILEQLQSR